MAITPNLPTASKLFGAVVFMGLAFVLTSQAKEALGTASSLGLFAPINMVIGFVVGWRISGTRAGNGLTSAIGDSLTTVCVIYFWSVLIWSGYEMIKRSVRMRYDNPIEALQDMADMMVNYSGDVITPPFVAAAVFGSVACGVLTELISRRWS